MKRKSAIAKALYIGTSGRPVSKEAIQNVIEAVQLFEKDKSVTFIPKTMRNNNALYKAIMREKYEGKRLALLKILLQWASDELEEDLTFSAWEDAVEAASLQFNADESRKGLSKEEQETRTKQIEAILGSLASSIKADIDESSLSLEKRIELRDEVLPKLRHAASDMTSLFTSGYSTLPSEEDEDLPLGLHRRKRHNAGISALPGYKISYRSYEGTISPQPNAYILGGSLDGDYAPLFERLVAAIGVETAKEKRLGDKGIAALFLREFNGENAFSLFSPETQLIAHKIIAIMLFAELSRHSIALVSAAATFFVIANHKDAPGLFEAFATGSTELRPLFAGTDGPNLMRGKDVSLTESEVLQRSARATLDLNVFYGAEKDESETISTFIKRRTYQYVVNLSRNSSHKALDMDIILVPVLVDLLKRIIKSKSETGDTVATLVGLGFEHHQQPGDENNCAIESLYDQLSRHYTFDEHEYEVFVKFIRERINVPFGQMIDLTTQGILLLTAAREYLTAKSGANPTLVLDVWAAAGNGNVMEFQGVAQSNGTGPTIYLTFYYNGVNHFDSLTGGLAR